MIQVMDSSMHHGVSSVLKILATNLKKDLQGYNEVLHDLDLTWAVDWQTSPRASPMNTRMTLQMLISAGMKPQLQTMKTTPRYRYGGCYDHPGHRAACEAITV